MLITLRQSKRAFVEKLDFQTSGGHMEGGDSRARLRLPGKGPTAVITDLGIMTPDPVTKELTLTSVHPGISLDSVVAATEWKLKIAVEVDDAEADENGIDHAARSQARTQKRTPARFDIRLCRDITLSVGDSLTEIGPQSDYFAPQAEGLKNSHKRCDKDHYIQKRFDTRGHRNAGIDKPQYYSCHQQCQNNAQNRSDPLRGGLFILHHGRHLSVHHLQEMCQRR